MKEKIFNFKSIDGFNIFTYSWLPNKENEIKAVVQIAHGMAEHAARYHEFAEFLTDNGFGVYANDHRGHGKTAGSLDKVGFFAESNGWDLVVSDMHSLTEEIKKEHPNIPVFLLGHSMGSMLSRDYASKYGNEIRGLILSGTAADPGMLGNAGIAISKISGMLFGKESKSPLLDKLSFGAFNGKFKPNRTAFDWLSRDETKVDKYVRDPYCGSVFSKGFFYDMLTGLKKIHMKAEIGKIPTALPIFFISGEKDPVGKNSNGVKKVVKMYGKSGIENVDLKFYPDARHEILNETNREEVYRDILSWISNILN